LLLRGNVVTTVFVNLSYGFGKLFGSAVFRQRCSAVAGTEIFGIDFLFSSGTFFQGQNNKRDVECSQFAQCVASPSRYRNGSCSKDVFYVVDKLLLVYIRTVCAFVFSAK